MPSKFYCKHTLIARVCYGMLANVFYLQSDFNELLKSDTLSTTFECVFSIFFCGNYYMCYHHYYVLRYAYIWVFFESSLANVRTRKLM